MGAILGRGAQVQLTTTPSVAMTNLALINLGDNKTFVVDHTSAKRVWDDTATFVFQTSPDGTTWSSASPHDVRYVDGAIMFSSAVSGATPSARVASGKYLPSDVVISSYAWGADFTRDAKEDTRFTANQTPVLWRTFVKGVLGGTFKLSAYVVDDAVGIDFITEDMPMIATMFFDVVSGKRLVCAGHITKESLAVAVGDPETEELDFQVTGPVYKI